MSKLLLILAAALIGALLTIQPGLNADVARRVGTPFGAGLLSIVGSFAIAVALFFGTRQSANWGPVLSMPWYLWLAGSVGVIAVVGTTLLAPILGAALMIAAIVAGQMIAAMVVDYIGFSGYAERAFDWWRVAGIGLVLAGVWAFSRAA